MVPYEELLPIEQAIVDFKMENPYFCGFLFGIIVCVTIALVVFGWKKSRDDYAEKIKRERAEKRALIKANGGL